MKEIDEKLICDYIRTKSKKDYRQLLLSSNETDLREEHFRILVNEVDLYERQIDSLNNSLLKNFAFSKNHRALENYSSFLKTTLIDNPNSDSLIYRLLRHFELTYENGVEKRDKSFNEEPFFIAYYCYHFLIEAGKEKLYAEYWASSTFRKYEFFFSYTDQYWVDSQKNTINTDWEETIEKLDFVEINNNKKKNLLAVSIFKRLTSNAAFAEKAFLWDEGADLTDRRIMPKILEVIRSKTFVQLVQTSMLFKDDSETDPNWCYQEWEIASEEKIDKVFLRLEHINENQFQWMEALKRSKNSNFEIWYEDIFNPSNLLHVLNTEHTFSGQISTINKIQNILVEKKKKRTALEEEIRKYH